MTKKFERPLHPLASWTDTVCSEEDNAGRSASFASNDDIEYCLRLDEDNDYWEANPKSRLSSLRRIDRWVVEVEHGKDSNRGDGGDIVPCWNRKQWTRKWSMFVTLTLLLVGLLWATVYLGVHNARMRRGKSGNPVVDGDQPIGMDTNDKEEPSGTSLPWAGTNDPTIEESSPSVYPTQAIQATVPPTENQSDQPSRSPTLSPTPSPTPTPPVEQPPTIIPTDQINIADTLSPVPPPQEQNNEVSEDPLVSPEAPSSSMEQIVVLHPNEFLEAGQFRSSPNGQYRVEVTNGGDLVLTHEGDTDRRTIWSTKTAGNGVRLYLQTDGNVLLRNAAKATLWSSETHGYPGARLIITDAGKLSLQNEDFAPTHTSSSSEVSTAIWMDGVPRSVYRGPPPSTEELQYPVRGIFYYPWYPQTWTVNGHQARFDAALGMYSSSDPEVARVHVDAMEYAHIDLSIASWWGPDTHLDKARLTMLMDQTIAMNSRLKWSVYHEGERELNPTVGEIRADLDYLKKWFVWHEAWAHKNGKPVIFVYNEAGCDVANRWKEASNGEWYVVLKLFPGFLNCPSQPDSWHQYGCGEVDGTIHNPGHSFVLSPGFWRADKDVPLLPRVTQDTFCKNTERMVASGEQWQLIVSFNEAGEGTMIENSPQWPSNSGYGQYLDCLNTYG
ncbi:glycosyl hydrolase family 99 protein [Nitzschia inconspicua]|uniref:Glycosyl hydrolase family 99 protein n=1 Tax=Nitzschia inconspicua TaxID=303405 RepID=A0A9K3LTM0_9STRA|nr:glycosyl hydrolase family 99 protein [Nitzschia inconspicua]